MNNDGSINQLIARYTKLVESEENQRRLELWDRIDEGIRGIAPCAAFMIVMG